MASLKRHSWYFYEASDLPKLPQIIQCQLILHCDQYLSPGPLQKGKIAQVAYLAQPKL